MSWKENTYNVQKYYSSTPNSNSNLKQMNNNINNTNNNINCNINSKSNQHYYYNNSNNYQQRERMYTSGVDDCNGNYNRGQISPIKLNNSTNTRQYYQKSETTSPTSNLRSSPKMRNSHSYSWSSSSSSTSPFKQQYQFNNNNNSKSIQNSPEKSTVIIINRKRNNSGGYSSSCSSSSNSSNGNGNNTSSSSSSITGGALIGGVDNAVAVPNPFGGSKYRDPPPADILPKPPMQWCLDSNDSIHGSNSTVENDSFNIIQKLNDSYSRLTAAVKA